MVALAPANAQTLQRPAADHYDVVALRVEFQPDTTRFTTGDGTFDGELFEEGLQPSVDPLPHNAGYFQAHLDFLAHYVEQVSDGQTRLTTHLVPEVIRLSQEMGAYSPTGFDSDSDVERAKLAALIEEAWTTASGRSAFDLSGFDPERTAFVIFHAGVGRDIELLGTPLDKTPQDLPSLFFSEQTLGRLASGPIAFNGVPVRHTLLIPRTETRPGFNFIADEPFLLELSINGLLAASFFNYLGAPDLFNTTDGQSAIGPFGLMDPLGFFAYNGLFAPEPNAWTKYFLGWTTPVDLVGNGPETVQLPAVGTEGTSFVARARISSSEYFLIENRHRDMAGDGLFLQVWKDGEIIQQRFENGAEDFTRLAGIDGFIGGVVVGVDDYDWALPGGLDEDDNVLNGGILIWHVDERRLAERLETGGVNADPERRAVDLEEADSAQDIGFPSPSPFGPAADQGTPFDFFFLDNPITTITAGGQELRFYENRFGPETIPNSNSNEDGASFIVFEDFSAPAPVMTVVYRREGIASIAPAVSVENLVTEGTASAASFLTGFSEGGVDWIAFTGSAIDAKEAAFFNEDTGVVSSYVFFDGGDVQTVVTEDGRLAVATLPPEASAGRIDLAFFDNGSVGEPTPFAIAGDVADLTPPMMALVEQDGPAAFYLEAVLANPPGNVAVKMVEEAAAEVIELDGQRVFSVASDGRRAVLVGEREVRVVGGTERWTYDFSDEGVGQAAFGRDSSGLVGVVPLLASKALLVLRADGTTQRIDLDSYGDLIIEGSFLRLMSDYPILADFDDDGRLDVLTIYGRRLMAFSQDGALVRGFPIALSALSVAQPLVAELSDSGAWSIIVASTDGYIYAYDLGDGGRLVPGFPLAAGSSIQTTPLLQDKNLYAISVEGDLRGWELTNLGTIWWGQLYGNAQHQSYVELTAEPDQQPSPQAAGLIVEAETYNWPNPIREGQTFLRCMTTQDASVRITIIDAAGSLIDEVALDLQGGTPAEHLWQTNAASGLYFARVTATGSGGETATKLIKMAIIR